MDFITNQLREWRREVSERLSVKPWLQVAQKTKQNKKNTGEDQEEEATTRMAAAEEVSLDAAIAVFQSELEAFSI